MVEYVNYTRNLKFEEDPDYKYLKGLLTKILIDNNEEFDYMYDWSTTKPDLTIAFKDEGLDSVDLKSLENIDVDSKRNTRPINTITNSNSNTNINDNNNLNKASEDHYNGVLLTEQAQYNAPVPHNLEEEK